jgi:hypothetical protein
MNTVKKAFAALAVCAMALLGVATIATTPAFAATAGFNGQQIELCPGPLMAHGHAKILGINQDGVYSVSPEVPLPQRGICATLQNWWWVGHVDIAWRSTTGLNNVTPCYVPKYLQGDLVSCYGE